MWGWRDKVEDGKRVKGDTIGCGCFSNYGSQMNFPLLIIFLSTLQLTAVYPLPAMHFT